MSFYECVFIVRQDVSGPQVETLADHFTKVIEENGGSVARRENWGLRSLAFRIRKNRKGHYVLLYVDAPAGAIHEVERQMRINEDVLRHMTVRVDQLSEGPSAMLQSRGSKDERPRREDRWRGERSRGFGEEGGRRSYGDEGRRSHGDENRGDDDEIRSDPDRSSMSTGEIRE